MTLNPLPRFEGAAAWSKLSPEQQAEIGAIALELAAAFAAQEQEVAEINLSEKAALRAIGAAEPMLLQMLADAAGLPGELVVPSLLGRVCRGCGCSENDACEGGCAWAPDEIDLCTACA